MSTEGTSAISRTLSILSVLKGKTLHGMSNTDIAKATRIPAPSATRILAQMIADGFIMQYDTGRYALSVRMLSIAQAHADEMSRAQEKITELTQRVHAGARQ